MRTCHRCRLLSVVEAGTRLLRAVVVNVICGAVGLLGGLVGSGFGRELMAYLRGGF